MSVQLLEREQKKEIQPTTTDKRYFPRWEVNKRVEHIEEGEFCFRSCTKDLSLEGASIFVFGNPPMGKHFQLKIHMSDKVNFHTRGHVVWNMSGPTYKLFGIVFDRLSKSVQELILCHAYDLRNDDLFVPNDNFNQ